MTAEIALMNRSALALAADSAVTLQIGSQQKTYNTAEKIFEFSCRQPIALMIYNNVEFLGIPFNVLIRAHRRQNGKDYRDLEEASQDFIEFISTFDDSENHHKAYLLEVLAAQFEQIADRFNVDIGQQPMTSGLLPAPDEAARLEAVLEQAITEEENGLLSDYLGDKTIDDFIEHYGDVCREAADLKLWPELRLGPGFSKADLTGRYMDLLYRYAFAIIRSENVSERHTGLVFGGFGTNDLFPCLYQLDIDGIYFGSPKLLNRSHTKIDREGNRAKIIPFAQVETVERFINGVDQQYVNRFANYLELAVDTLFATLGPALDESISGKIKFDLLANFYEMSDELKVAEQKSMLDIVNFMSKKELAEMAHALVELTSAKRRFSMDQETVGGPIDVAIVSRSEALIWIRRKNYFDRDMNPGFFHRVFPTSR